jgi:glycosyltransferase involved in cell wall biosynthesis
MRRLLAVSWEMPPMYGPRATQVSRVLGQLAGLGWRPTTICLAPRPGGPHWFNGIAPDAPLGVELVRVPSPEEWVAVRAAWRVAPRLRDFPDATRVWVPRAAHAAVRIAAAGDCTGMITFAQPWSDHLVGLRVRRATGLPWVAHFSDPWADSPYATPHQRSIWRRMEEEVVREATAVVFVTEETADLVMAKYPGGFRDKVSVVPHGFDSRLHGSAPRPADNRRPLRLVFAGRFYAGIRTPTPLLRALARLNARDPLAGQLEVLFIGPHVQQYERDAAVLGVDSLVQFRGRVPPAEAARAAADADVLLVIDAPSDGPSVFLPSKLIDYLPFKKPILGVTPASGASARLLRRLGCPVAPPDDVDAIAAALAGLVRRWREGTLAVGASFESVAAEFDISRTARVLHDVLIRAFDERRPNS